MQPTRESISFFRQFLSNPGQIGAVAPSSRQLALSLTTPLARKNGSGNILEVGAGTGAVTRHIIRHLGPQDRLDICEANPRLANLLEADLSKSGTLRTAMQEQRVRLFARPVQEVTELIDYDFIISGLPLNAFELRDVRTILRVIQKHAKPSCVFSYFEYIGVRNLKAAILPGVRGKKFRYLSAYLSRWIHAHEFQRQSVFMNVPPAYARHLRFSKNDS